MSPSSTPREVSKSVSFRLEGGSASPVESIPLQVLSSSAAGSQVDSMMPTPPSSQSVPSPPETPPPIPPPRSIDQVKLLAKVRGSCEVSDWEVVNKFHY